MSEVRIVILKDFKRGAGSPLKVGDIINENKNQASRLVNEGLACYYSEFKRDMLLKEEPPKRSTEQNRVLEAPQTAAKTESKAKGITRKPRRKKGE